MNITSLLPRIAIVGAGLIGQSWAIVFARSGHEVVLHDADPRRLELALEAVTSTLGGSTQHGAVRAEASLKRAVAQADHVQENAPERLDVKRELFADLDRFSPRDATLASSSSALTCSAICAELEGRERCIIAHPANPPHLLKAVEIVPAPFTSPTTIDRTTALLESVGQVAVPVGEIDGFVMNRLQAALASEALRLVEAGVASAASVDAIVRHSLGMRWAFMGPFETMDLNAPGGFSDYAARYGSAFSGMIGSTEWSEEAVRTVDRERRATLPLDRMSDRQAWRDRRLAALGAHLAEQDAAQPFA